MHESYDAAHSELGKYTGSGCYLRVEGDKTYIDAASGTFNLPLGYNNARIATALKEQIDRCSHLSSDVTRGIARHAFDILLAEAPKHITDFWFRDITGSTANECAIRIAQKYTGKTSVISLFGAHHGQTLATTGISGNAFRLASFSGNASACTKIPAPYCKKCFYKKSPSSCDLLCATRLEDFIEFASDGSVACLIIEPVQGNGGNILPPPGYLKKLREICDQHGILIIADEVQTGFGRTGTFFASTGIASELRPDIITFAKGAGGIGIPVAGVLMTRELAVLEPYEHSTTSGANPLALVALLETARILKESGVLEQVRRNEPLLRDGLNAIKKKYPMVLDVRGVGYMFGFDVPSPELAGQIVANAKSFGLLVRSSRYGLGKTVKVRPPLICNERQIGEILAKLEAAIKVVSAQNPKEQPAASTEMLDLADAQVC